MKTRYRSLDDFLRTVPLHVDGCLDDGWGAQVSVKGREIDAAVVFCDISGFSARTADMTPAETLILVNNFFAWVSAEALQSGYGIVDKYIGDAVMLVFSDEFGSEDPVGDALRAAHAMCDRDVLSFQPHVGIAAGRVIVGYVGSPLSYSCSVFGAPVTLAARCAGFRPKLESHRIYSTVIVFPAELWKGRKVDDAFPPRRYTMPDGQAQQQPQSWELLGPFDAALKNIQNRSLMVAANALLYRPMMSAEERARVSLKLLQDAKQYRPRWPEARPRDTPDG